MTHITLPREVLEQALDALQECQYVFDGFANGELKSLPPAITALRTALEAAPAARVPLSDEQIETMLNENFGYKDMHTFARAIEAHHGIGREQK